MMKLYLLLCITVVASVHGDIEEKNDSKSIVTQTVYGFLDFTTTIANTVIVFSPQSQPAPKKIENSSINNVIETKPTKQPQFEINPSKTILKSSSNKNIVKSANEVHLLNKINSKTMTASPDRTSPQIHVLPTTNKLLSNTGEVIHHVESLPTSNSLVPQPNTNLKSDLNLNSESKTDLDSSVTEVRDDDIPVLQLIGEPEYDFLSRQPSEFAEETYRIHNIRPSKNVNRSKQVNQSKKTSQHSHLDDIHPTGLVTKLGGTVVKDGITTVHETSVLGTYISGKYAQILQSTSQIYHSISKPKINPSSTLRVLKTAGPTVSKTKQQVVRENEKPNPESYSNSPDQLSNRSSRRQVSSSPGTFKARFRNRFNKDAEIKEGNDNNQPDSDKKSQRVVTPKSNRFNNRITTTSVELATISVFSETSTPYMNRRNKATRAGFKTTPSSLSQSENGFTRRFKPKIQPSATQIVEPQSSSLYKFKLNRAPGRWQYKTSPKPRITIRKQSNDDTSLPLTTTATNDVLSPPINEIAAASSKVSDVDLDSGPVNGEILSDAEVINNSIEYKKLLVETLKVEISTPVNFKDTYYEIATIKSPYTFQVGQVKNTRYITVTSTFEKTIDPETSTESSIVGPLTENILASTAHIERENNLLDSSIATLPLIVLASDVETPPLETLTETFSTTQILLKTHILPVSQVGGNSTSYTLTQTYHITRLVTATKTLPPQDAYNFNPTRSLKEFNSRLDEAGSELNLELEFGDNNEEDDEGTVRHALPADLDLSKIGTDFNLSEVDKTKITEGNIRRSNQIAKQQQYDPMNNLSPEQLQQLAILKFINPAAAAHLAAQHAVITTSKPIVRLETIFETHVIPIFNGVSTTLSTLSRAVSTISTTQYEIGTTALPNIGIPQVPINPLFAQQPQFQLTTAPVISQTMITQTDSKILKLTFGAKVAYTTLYSTTVIPTLLTTYITQSVALQPSAAFPGFFPGYGAYPFKPKERPIISEISTYLPQSFINQQTFDRADDLKMSTTNTNPNTLVQRLTSGRTRRNENSPDEILNFIEKQERYIEQLERESKFCRDELNNLLVKVKDVVKENELLTYEVNTGNVTSASTKDSVIPFSSDYADDTQKNSTKLLRGSNIIFESRISELEALLTQAYFDLDRINVENENNKRKIAKEG